MCKTLPSSDAQVVFIRHGRAENQEYGIGGLIERGISNQQCSLVEEGRNQLVATREFLSGNLLWIPDSIFTSPFQRNLESTSILFPDQECRVEDSLKEYWRGIWYTLPKNEIREKYKNEWGWNEKYGMTYDHRPPEGESVRDVHDDKVLVFLKILKTVLDQNKKVAIVGHGNWLLMMRSLQLGIQPDEFPDWFKERRENGGYDNASVTSFAYDSSVRDMIHGLCVIQENIVPWKEK